MSYNDLSSVKKINGVPVDLNYYTKAIENDLFFKSVNDTDEDMSALDRDIIPATTILYNLGNATKHFLSGYIKTLNSEVLNLLGGSGASPSLMVGTVGLASANSGELSVVASSLEALKITAALTKVRAANNSQLAIENTLPGSLSTWYLGTDENGFRIGSGTNAGSTRLEIGLADTISSNRLLLPLGTEFTPALSFSGFNTSGLYKSSNGVGFSSDGVAVVEITATGLENKKSHKITKLEWTTLGLDQEINITGVSKLLIDTTNGDIGAKGFIGGEEGQMLYIIKKVAVNTFSIKNTDLTAVQSVNLKGGSDYANSNSFGGIILSFDDGVWREVSRS